MKTYYIHIPISVRQNSSIFADQEIDLSLDIEVEAEGPMMAIKRVEDLLTNLLKVNHSVEEPHAFENCSKFKQGPNGYIPICKKCGQEEGHGTHTRV
jgi:hypothetical protein